MKLSVLFLSFLFLSGCAHHRFEFAEQVSDDVRNSVRDYQKKRILSNGQIYGSSMRDLNLAGQTAHTLDEEMKTRQCPRTDDVIREPKQNKPVKDANGKTNPIWIWLCSDGGVVRAKPLGDPTNKYRPLPHSSKSLWYPTDAPYKNFASETAKIDNDGNVLPKWPADLKSKDPAVIQDWGNRSHTDLVTEKSTEK